MQAPEYYVSYLGNVVAVSVEYPNQIGNAILTATTVSHFIDAVQAKLQIPGGPQYITLSRNDTDANLDVQDSLEDALDGFQAQVKGNFIIVKVTATQQTGK